MRPSNDKTTLDISLFIKSILSSSSNTPLVVIVNLKFLLYIFSCSLAYFTVSLTTSKFINGSPPKKSISKFFLPSEWEIKKSTAFLATSKGIKFRSWPKFPVDAKQYLHLKLQSCATCKHIALTGILNWPFANFS